MQKIQSLLFLVFLLSFVSCYAPTPESSIDVPAVEDVSENKRVVLSSEINWSPLNPARGDQSPQAGDVWGDRKKDTATGFLVKFKDGFSSPPHIHNVTYRAVVLKGLIHNDDPEAEKMWMPAGSFWTQPAGESHITAAQGEENMAYVEIDSGPYLVKPTDAAFDEGERPINIDRRNIVWLNAEQSRLIETPQSGASPEIAYLWENAGTAGYFLKLPAKFQGFVRSEGEAFHALVVSGEFEYLMSDSEEAKILDTGSYFTSEGAARHSLQNKGEEDVVLYLRTNGSLNVEG